MPRKKATFQVKLLQKIGRCYFMYTSDLYNEYESLLRNLSKTRFFGLAAVTHYLKDPRLKDTGLKDFYKNHALVVKDKISKENYIDVRKEEHPTVCGGVTEYLTKIRLARNLNVDLEELKFFDDVKKPKYKNISDEDLAFYLYELDIFYRSSMGYTEEIKEHINLIIDKARLLSDIALKLIYSKFPTITYIDFHPDGHVLYKNKLAIKGDSDLLINNCLIDFKTKKDASISLEDRAQLFAYSINKYARDGVEYDKVYLLNPRYNYIGELVRKD